MQESHLKYSVDSNDAVHFRIQLPPGLSVAAMVLTTESLVTDKPDPQADAAAAAAMAAQGGGMY